ncbi:MAG: sugar porter family MFS transporter [Planctomycetota bacterium]
MRIDTTLRASMVVALGGALLGFDSAVVNGVVGPVRDAFDLTPTEVGWTTSCLILGAMGGNAAAGPLAAKFGRRTVLIFAALLFTVSALWSALATSLETLVVARIIGGLGVGAAILIAPIYIAEIAPPARRGRLVSFNQLGIVVGISAAFFSNFFLNGYFEEQSPEAQADAWRWMLGVEAVPALLYFLLLWTVPRSPRWLMSQGRRDEAEAALTAFGSSIAELPREEPKAGAGSLRVLFSSKMSRVLVIALGLAFFQQITGINAIFYYASTIFEKAGAGVSSQLSQSIIIGLVNLVFTIVAMRMIDKVGRKPLLLIGSAGMAAALLTTSSAFSSAEYRLDADTVAKMVADDATSDDPMGAAALEALVDENFTDRDAFLAEVGQVTAGLPEAEAAAFGRKVGDVAKAALVIDGRLVLFAIMLFIASFAISLGPVMWTMLSEVFPAEIRGIGISVAGFFNSLVSWSVVQLFPWELENLGPTTTFLIFGVLAVATFVFTLVFVPETKGRSLEELEAELVRA